MYGSAVACEELNVSEPLELELQLIEQPDLSEGNLTWVPGKVVNVLNYGAISAA